MATRRRASQSSLTGSISDLQRRVRYLQNKQTPTRLGNQSVLRSAIQYQAVGTDQIAPRAIANSQIQFDAIQEAQLDEDSVTRDAIKNGEVVAGKLGTNAVVSDNILDGEVKDGKLGAASVNLINMKPNSVDNGQLITDSVNFRTVDTNAIGNENMLDNSVGNSELQNDSVGNGELQNDSVGFAELQGGSVGNSTLQDGSVTSSKIGSGQVGSSQIANGAVGANQLANNSVSGIKIQNGSITGSDLANGTITSLQIANGSYSTIVSGGLSNGYGISKSGSRISVDTGVIARNSHTHSYSRPTRDSFGGALTNYTSASTTTAQYSSKRLKNSISSHKIADPKKLLALDFKKFKYKRPVIESQKSANREWMHGYLIEDLMELGFEEVVHYNEKGEPERLDYGLFSTLVLELVKVQQQEIEYLKEKVEKLEISNDE